MLRLDSTTELIDYALNKAEKKKFTENLRSLDWLVKFDAQLKIRDTYQNVTVKSEASAWGNELKCSDFEVGAVKFMTRDTDQVESLLVKYGKCLYFIKGKCINGDIVDNVAVFIRKV